MLKRIIEKGEKTKLNFWQTAFLIYAASFFRGFLENFANADNGKRIMGILDTFFHYPLWYLGVFLCLIIIIKFLTGEKIEKISQFGALFLFIILFAPVFDLIINKGAQTRYCFITGSASDFFHSFINFFGAVPGKTPGASIGLKLEILLIISAITVYIFQKTKKIKRALVGAVLSYITIFIFFILPTILYIAYGLITPNLPPANYENVNNFYYLNEPSLSLASSKTYILDQNPFKTAAQNTQNHYSLTISMALLLIDAIILAWWFKIYNNSQFMDVLKNFRPLRIVHYFLLILAGIGFGLRFNIANRHFALIDILSMCAAFAAILFAWLFSVWENDEQDIEIDKISNSSRPLAQNKFSSAEWKNIKFLFLFLSLSFAFLGGFYLFNLTLLFLLIYHIYSARPLRLKSVIGLSSLLIATNALLAVMVGFFSVANTENLFDFPINYAFGILFIFALSENVKNLKDIDGDKKNGVKTLANIFKTQNAKLIIGSMVFISAILVPIFFFPHKYTFGAAIVFGSILFFLINKKKFVEKYVFFAYIAFAIIFMAEFWLLK